MLSLSLQAVYDDTGARIMDARLFVYQAGTTTPAPSFYDAEFASRQPHPMKARGNGTLPLVYLSPGSYRVRVTDSMGKQIDQIDGYTVIGATGGGSGGGGGGSVEASKIAQTGDEKWRYGTGPHAGWVRENGRTIGSAASGATERANDDCHGLYVLLWSQDANLAVVGGRGPNAESDWVAGKPIALPDMRGRTQVALDDMGSAAAGRLSGGTFAFGNATTLGAYGGLPSSTLTLAQMPSHSHPVSASMDSQGHHAHTGVTDAQGEHGHTGTVDANGLHGHNGTTSSSGGHAHAVTYSVGTAGSGGSNRVVTDIFPNGNNNAGGQTAGVDNHNHTFRTDADGVHAHTFATNPNGNHAHNLTTSALGAHVHNIVVSMSAEGSGAPFSLMQPFSLRTLYIKL